MIPGWSLAGELLRLTAHLPSYSTKFAPKVTPLVYPSGSSCAQLTRYHDSEKITVGATLREKINGNDIAK